MNAQWGAPQNVQSSPRASVPRGDGTVTCSHISAFYPPSTQIFVGNKKRRRLAWEVKELDLSDREEFASAAVYLSVTGGKVFYYIPPDMQTCSGWTSKKVRPGASGCAGMTCKSVQRFTYLLCKCSFSCRKRGETK